MNLNRKLSLLATFIIGLLVPFIPYLVIVELFFLLIPFGIVFAISLIYLIVSLIKNLDRQKAIFVFLILPTFIFSQLVSSFMVDKIQRFRSEKIIKKVEEHKTKKGELPQKIETKLGIQYVRMEDGETYTISYSRGFLVREKYQSKYKHWRAYGWND